MPASFATSIFLKTPNAIRRPLDASVVVLPLFLLGFLLARFAAPVFMLLPVCTFRAALGFPCPSCGVTRAGLALAQGDWLKACAYNPLLVVSIGILSLWSAGQWLEILGRKNFIALIINEVQKRIARVYSQNENPRGLNHAQSGITDNAFHPWNSPIRGNWRRWLVISAIGLNWLYLIISG